MAKYLVKRLLHGAVSIIIVVGIVMLLIYSLMDRNLVFAKDSAYTHQVNNNRTTYKYAKWEEFGYLDYVPYTDYIEGLYKSGEIDEETYDAVSSIGQTADQDKDEVKEYVQKFTEYYESKGYTVTRLDVVKKGRKVADGGRQTLFAYKDISIVSRMWTYFSKLITIDNIHNVQEDIGTRGLTFTWYDPVYGGSKFSPALMGNGTTHKYLFYCNNKFPYVHQNLITISLGTSYSVNKGVDVFTTMTQSQGIQTTQLLTYPTGLTEETSDDLHSATYSANSLENSKVFQARFTDDYTNTLIARSGKSKMGYSFLIGIIEVVLAYIIGLPLGLLMARKKDKLADKIGTFYIVFIMAVPSLAYIFLFKAIGGKLGLPTTFDLQNPRVLMYVLPVVSLALPAVANLMKWMRRYMIDQMNSDYVKFARSGGLSETEIFVKHIMKNAAIPIVHGIPADILFALTGAIITERVYAVPGAGNLLTTAISTYDNGVIVGMSLFYALLSVLAVVLGDILMSLVDPRISFSEKDR